jgi:arylformamidase
MDRRDLTAVVEELCTLWHSVAVVDLSHTLEEGMPTYPTHAKFFQNPWLSMGDPAKMNQLFLSEHTGTHVDAPSHFPEASPTPALAIDQVEIGRFAGRARCLHVTVVGEANWQLSAREIEAWEDEYGSLRPGEIVLIDFGWAKRWSLWEAGFGYLTGWPGLARDAAELLRARRVGAVGTDCVGLDAGDGGGGLPAHRTLLPAGILIYENLANLDQLGDELFFVGFPLKIGNGTGSPVRALGLVSC